MSETVAFLPDLLHIHSASAFTASMSSPQLQSVLRIIITIQKYNFLDRAGSMVIEWWLPKSPVLVGEASVLWQRRSNGAGEANANATALAKAKSLVKNSNF